MTLQRGGPELAAGGSPWPTPSQTLLLKACIGPDAEALSAFSAWLETVDLEGAVDGGSFRLLPLLFTRLQALGCTHPFMGRLKGVYRQAWCENHLLFASFAPVIAALERAGVPTLLLKGAPLALGYYASHACRPMLDLDVAAPCDRRDAVRRVMQEIGWRVTPHSASPAADDLHALEFRSPQGAEVDIHFHVLRETPCAKADAWFWRDRRPLELCGVLTSQPSPTAMALNTVLHGVRTNFEPPIRWIADMAQVLAAEPEAIDWDAIAGFARTYGVACRLRLGFEYLAATFQLPVPAGFIAELRRMPTTLPERIENLIYLGSPQRMYRPKLFPLLDYWRFRRTKTLGRFLLDYPAYLKRHWRLSSRLKLPAAVMGSVGRSAQRLIGAS